jgi:transposase
VSHNQLKSLKYFRIRLLALVAQEPLLEDAVAPLLHLHEQISIRLKEMTNTITAAAKSSPVSARLMTVPGVGPMTALSFVTAIDDPYRFQSSQSVGAYLGLPPRQYQSGQVDWSGRISKHGDAIARAMLYEAANCMLTRVKKRSAPKTWGTRLVKRLGPKKARVALARKLAVILHRMWVDGTDFRCAT